MKKTRKLPWMATLTAIFVGFTHFSWGAPEENGFKRIFNGTDLTGWIGGNVSQGYKIENGELITQAGCKSLVTEREFEDYILRFEFNLQSYANNGLGLRAPKVAGDVAYTCFEIQILDDTHPSYAKLKPWQYHGSAYGILAAQKGSLKPLGEWNQQEVKFVGTHLTITVNGNVILDSDLATVVRAPDTKNYARNIGKARGHLCLAAHGPGVKFRNLEVKDLATDYSLSGQPDNTPPAGFTALFDGSSLNNFQGLMEAPNDNPFKRATLSPEEREVKQQQANETMKKHWTVKDGALAFDGGGRSLATQKKYGNFEMYASYKIKPNGDTGIYLRGLPQVQVWDPDNAKELNNGADKGSGGLWNNNDLPGRWPLERADKPVGEWNTLFVRFIDGNATIYLNGKLVVNGAQIKNYWQAGAIPEREQIELQAHQHPVWWKNVYLRELYSWETPAK